MRAKAVWVRVTKGASLVIHAVFDRWAFIGVPLIWLRDVLTFLLQRFLYEESTFTEVRRSSYPPHPLVDGVEDDSSQALTVDQIADTEAEADALLALAERKASEADDRNDAIQAKARFQLTLCGLLLAAIWSLSDAPLSTPAALAGLAFVAALFLLLRVLQTGATTVVEVRREVFDMDKGGHLKRYHASRLLEAAAENHGRLDFLVGVQRTAARAIHLGLIGVLWLGVETAFDQGEAPPETTGVVADPDDLSRVQPILDSLVDARVQVALDSLVVPPTAAPSPPDSLPAPSLPSSTNDSRDTEAL